MLVAAYLVGGFPDRVGLRDGHAARSTRPVPPTRLHHPVHRRRDHDADPDARRRHARSMGLQQRTDQVRRDRVRPEDQSSDVPETLLGHLNSNGTGERRIRDSRPRVVALGSRGRARTPRSRASTAVAGELERPTIQEANIVHLAWDVMVGLGDAAVPAVRLVRGCVALPARLPEARSCSCWLASGAGVLSVLALEAGWVVTEVGRQPWIVLDYMKVEQAATSEPGRVGTFLVDARALRRSSASPRS